MSLNDADFPDLTLTLLLMSVCQPGYVYCEAEVKKKMDYLMWHNCKFPCFFSSLWAKCNFADKWLQISNERKAWLEYSSCGSLMNILVELLSRTNLKYFIILSGSSEWYLFTSENIFERTFVNNNATKGFRLNRILQKNTESTRTRMKREQKCKCKMYWSYMSWMHMRENVKVKLIKSLSLLLWRL